MQCDAILMKSLFKLYDAAVAHEEIVDSGNQRRVLKTLNTIYKSAINPPKIAWWQRLWSPKIIMGVYIYGPVGVGKTYLMNLFYDALPEEHKKRFHFHHFMQHVDKALRASQGMQNPLKHIASTFAEGIRVLCLDEFLVEDVADASILGELLSELFRHGLTLVATANTKPDDLYLDGLHRERFLPAIDLINVHCKVMCLDDHTDYRVGREALPDAYLYPVNKANEALMRQQFLQLSGQSEIRAETRLIAIQSRDIEYIGQGERVIWFDFHVICNMPRSQLDYLEIAKRFDTVFVSHVRALSEDDAAQLILFIRFVDVMYDEGVHLVLLADTPVDAIYLQGPMSKMFERTLSRLKEMQSADYWMRGRPT